MTWTTKEIWNSLQIILLYYIQVNTFEYTRHNLKPNVVQCVWQFIIIPFIDNNSVWKYHVKIWTELIYKEFCIIVPGWVLPYLGMVGRFRGDDPRFRDFQSDYISKLYLNTIRLAASFCKKNRFVSITFSSRATRT